MTRELNKWRLAMADRARQVMSLLADINEMEKTVSRLKNELLEEYSKIDEALDKDGRDRSTKG